MRDARESYNKIKTTVPADIKAEVNLSFDISKRIVELMDAKGITRKQLADALGKRPCEVTKWLSGQHNFTISTLSMLSSFFGKPIVSVG
jgi:ribosome-binding protein aMBF1 (putative translation factor)